MARTRRIRRDDGDAHYHLMSRTNDRRFLFSKGRVKGEIVSLLRKAAEFSGVRLEAWCVMDNHFHIVCEVTKPVEPISEAVVLSRIAALKGEKFASELGEHWAELRQSGMEAMVEAALERWRSRMDDLSEFVKSFKELVNVMYKAEREHCGGLWSGRFKSTLIEDGRYLATCIRYVELNPVRAGMVKRAAEYAWSSAREAKAAETLEKMGSVPDERRLERRAAQIGGGVIFGSREFVMAAIFGHGHCFVAAHVAAKPVEDWAFASHGQKLAEKGEERLSLEI